MVTVHRVLAFLVVGACVSAGVLAAVARLRRSGGPIVAHALALAQTLVVAEVAFGLLLLADDRHADRGEHYMYGSLAVASLAWPWFYAAPEPRRRLVWFAGATALAAILAVRAWMTA